MPKVFGPNIHLTFGVIKQAEFSNTREICPLLLEVVDKELQSSRSQLRVSAFRYIEQANI